MTPDMLDSAIKSSGLEGIFEPSLSTDRVRVYKPDPRAYQMGIDAFTLKREEILSPRLAAGMRPAPSYLATRHSG
jgi:2-haloacid dehalogenase